MPELIAPTTRLHPAWLEAHHEWGPGAHEDGFGLNAGDEVESPSGFAAWVALLADEPDPSRARRTFRWIVEDGRVLGGIALRHRDDDFTRRIGHIGYGVRPSARRRGLASWALGRMLDVARTAGLGRVLIVCEAGNLPSARTIERHGGVLEGGVFGDSVPEDGVFGGGVFGGGVFGGGVPAGDAGPQRRYWIDLG